MTVLTPTRIAIKEILLATDFSPVSAAAAPYAVHLARLFEAKIHVIHVLVPSEWQPMPEAIAAGSSGVSLQLAEQDMAGFLKEVGFDSAHCDSRIDKGLDVWTTLARIIRSEHMDMIVVGTHGREGLKRLLLGSIAEGVFRNASCPVLTVGPRAAQHTPKPFRKMLFATDLTEESLRDVAFVEQFAEANQAQLIVAHVPPDKPQTHAERALAADSVRKWMREVIPPRPNLDYVVPFGELADAIVDTAENRECDLIILGAHPGTGMTTHLPGNIAHKIVAEAHCPVLIVHPPE